MGWKAIKDRYRIGHLVSVHKGKGICIGSGYVHDLIRINPETRKVEWGNLGPSTNDTLARYGMKFTKILRRSGIWLMQMTCLIVTFLSSLTRAEQWSNTFARNTAGPNVTHDGQMMYDNTFFEKEADARMAGCKTQKLAFNPLRLR
jgi:hypothetical protein